MAMKTLFSVGVRVAAVAVGAVALLGGCVVAPLEHPRSRPPVYRSPAPVPAPGALPAPQSAQSAPLYFYPERGQPEAVQDRDRFECYRWAVRETGTDPGMTAVRSDEPGRAPPVPYAAARRADGADVVAGAATGALMGAAVSSPRHAGANAVIGAIFGAAVGAASGEARNRAIDQAQARQADAQWAAAERARQPLDNFRRAMSACMQGRGYRVQ